MLRGAAAPGPVLSALSVTSAAQQRTGARTASKKDSPDTTCIHVILFHELPEQM